MEYIESEWKELENELDSFQKKHIEYVKKLEEVEMMKKTYYEKYRKFDKKLYSLDRSIKGLEKPKNGAPPVSLEEDKKEKLANIKTKVKDNLEYMRHISDTFPRSNTNYLKVIIGNVNVSILNKEEKWKYKEEYEKFKYNVTVISLVSAFLLLFITTNRVLDAMFNFLLVWYYCTLTIRESILVVNGSK